ncbi:hypothetical protein NX021_13930 [Cytobacillus firmus]|nr:hypothetical protein [Cytobacillus firmus]
MLLKESTLALKKKSFIINDILENNALGQRSKKVPSLHKRPRGDAFL